MRPTGTYRKLSIAALAAGGVLAGMVTAPAHADVLAWTVTGPAAGPTAQVRYDDADGTVSISVSLGTTTVLEPSPVGIRTQQADLSSGLEFVGRTDREIVERYTTTVGKERDRQAVMAESVFAFENDDGARLDLVVRASDDGVAYRYSLPQDYGSVLDETSAFDVPDDAAAWLARWRRDYENPFIEYTAATAPGQDFQMPALFEVDGVYLTLAESALNGSYTGPRLLHETGTGTYRVDFPWDDEVEVDGPLDTPWRVMAVGDLATVTESTLVDDLAPDAKVADTSWIEPDQVLWTWIAGGRAAGRSLEIQKGYVDYAAERGWPYVKVDAGWYFLPDPDGWDITDPDWQTNSWIPDLVEYGKARRVDIMVWVHYRDLDTAEERAQWLPTLHEWGVRGVKIDFMDAESQEILRWYDEILPQLAENELMVNFHGSNVPKGIHRTWPHVMTMEGVHGAEKGSRVTTDHLTTLPFTRNLIGSMDYTPGAYHRDTRPTTDAHETALAVLFESGLQDLAGTPESYDARPEAKRFLEQVPSVWDETRLLSGQPGDHVAMARRSGDRWFLGAGVSGAARTLDVPLDPLRGRWLVEVIRDGEDGMVRESHVVTGPRDTLSVPVEADGGFAAIACPWTPRVQTCDEPVDGIPATTVTLTPADGVQLSAGGSFDVSGEFRVDAAEPVTDVTFAPLAPQGWSVVGEPVTAAQVAGGDTVEGTWTITAPDDVEPGTAAIPVVASFRAPGDGPGDPLIESAAAVQVHILPPGWLQVVEGEASGNTFSGSARPNGCSGCSGGQKARFIGNSPDNHVTVNGVTVDQAGDYQLIVDYTVDGTRSFFVSVNGAAGAELPVAGTSWDTPASVTVPVSLAAGENSIRFYNDTAHGPDLDRIVIAEEASQ